MTAKNYLQLTNSVLSALNEVQLDNTTFSSAMGFADQAKDAVNQGLFDVYSYENTKWPFLLDQLTFTATRGNINYPQPSSVIDIDWESFHILRDTYTLTSLTQAAGVATATTTVTHTLKTGDIVYIDGANQAGYNKATVGITVTGATTFTYAVDSSTVSPATGTVTVKSNTVQWSRLYPVDIDEYKQSYAKIMENLTSDNFDQPQGIVRDQDNTFTIFAAPDRTYVIGFDAFNIPSKLSAYTDTHLVPEQYEQVIIDFAMHYAYMFRDNGDEAQLATKRAEDRVRRMRKSLMPVQTNVNWG